MSHRRIVYAIRTLASAALLLMTYQSARADSPGAVFAMTNALDGNEIVAFDRAADGSLSLAGSFATGGLGVGDTTEPEDALGSQGPLILSQDHRWLIAVNAGSDEISVFRVRPKGLVLVEKVSSGGPFPASLTLRWDLLYVLNSGNDGNITGFRLGNNGSLSPLAGSTRTLDAGGTNPPFFLVSPAQVELSPDGDNLVVTQKGSNEIKVFSIDADGLPSAAPVTTISNGMTPFGFAFDRRGRLFVAEAFGTGSVGDPGASAVSSYRIRPDGSLQVVSASVGNLQTASCWLRLARGRFVFTTNNASATVSSYAIQPDGSIALLATGGVAGSTGGAPVDVTVTPDGRFLYNVNAADGTVSQFRIQPHGGLISLGAIGGLPAEAGAVGIAAY